MATLEAALDINDGSLGGHGSADGRRGGGDVGDVDEKAMRLQIPAGGDLFAEAVKERILSQVPAFKQDTLASFIGILYQFYQSSPRVPGNQSACYAGQQAGRPLGHGSKDRRDCRLPRNTEVGRD